MKPTIRDIVRLAGASKSTVSRVFNKSTRVNPITREHVRRVIAEHDFAPDNLAMNGFDDMAPPFYVRPTLTTVQQPFHEIGQCAAEMLLSMIDPHFVPSRQWWECSAPSILDQGTPADEKHAWPSLHIQLPVSLSVRQSCDALYPVHYQHAEQAD